MREILFRGKRLDNGNWIIGQLINYEDGRARIIKSHTDIFCYEKDESIIQTVANMIDPSTVGQFTGLTDKNGTKIFVGDVIKTDNGKQKAISVVKYGNFRPKMIYHMFRNYIGYEPKQDQHGVYCETDNEQMVLFDSPTCIEVIGNIYDNPELLGGGG